MLKIDNVSKVFRKSSSSVQAVANVSLSVEKGQFVSVQGSSGSGKTTLLLIAGALSAPDSGTVMIGDVDPYELTSEAQSAFRAKNIGYVFQQFFLVPYLNVLDNILTASLASNDAPNPDRAMELIEKFGLSPRKHHLPGELSMGEKQRVALARALFNAPSLLLADEPTGNLDQANGQSVLQHLADYAFAGNAVLLVTHDPRSTNYATKTIAMEFGKIV